MTSIDLSLEQAQTLAKDHYENFPVAPFFLPKAYRNTISLIYAFARLADDIADEGEKSTEQRLAELNWMHQQLPDRLTGSPNTLFKHLNQSIQQHELPVSLFHDLLSAFEQDCVKSRYRDFDEVMDYCRRSANPIGRLLLHLTGFDTEQNLMHSDAICTGLQLINFCQDWHQDLLQRNRIYIPLSDINEMNIAITQLEQPTQVISPLIDLQLKRAEDIFNQGEQLGLALKGRFGLMIRLTILGGKTIIKKLKKRQTLTHRPVLKKIDWISMLLCATCKK